MTHESRVSSALRLDPERYVTPENVWRLSFLVAQKVLCWCVRAVGRIIQPADADDLRMNAALYLWSYGLGRWCGCAVRDCCAYLEKRLILAWRRGAAERVFLFRVSKLFAQELEVA